MQTVIVKTCTLGKPSNGLPTYSITTENGIQVFSLVLEPVGASIQVQEKSGYFINSVLVDGKPETKRVKPPVDGTEAPGPIKAVYPSKQSPGWQPNLPPYTSAEALAIMMDIVLQANALCFWSLLPEDTDKTAVLNSLFIACSRPLTAHAPRPLPKLADLTQVRAAAFVELLDNNGDT